MKYDLISFDCDGTLANTEYAVYEAFLHTLRRLGPSDYKKFDVHYIVTQCIGGTVASIFEQMAKDVATIISPEMQARVIAEYQIIVPDYLEAHLKPDAQQIEIIKKLSQNSKVCVTSNGLSRNVFNTIAIAGMGDIFGQNIFTAEMVAEPKPAPDLVLYVAQQMGITDMSRVLHIEDADRGARAGLAAGADTIGFVGHFSNKAAAELKLRNVGVQHVFDNWHDISAYALR